MGGIAVVFVAFESHLCHAERQRRMTKVCSPFQTRTANPYKMLLTARRQFTQRDIDRHLLATTIDRHSNSVAWAFA
jgi:hypothetical protein